MAGDPGRRRRQQHVPKFHYSRAQVRISAICVSLRSPRPPGATALRSCGTTTTYPARASRAGQLIPLLVKPRVLLAILAQATVATAFIRALADAVHEQDQRITPTALQDVCGKHGAVQTREEDPQGERCPVGRGVSPRAEEHGRERSGRPAECAFGSWQDRPDLPREYLKGRAGQAAGPPPGWSAAWGPACWPWPAPRYKSISQALRAAWISSRKVTAVNPPSSSAKSAAAGPPSGGLRLAASSPPPPTSST
jgi:hypothetical protein